MASILKTCDSPADLGPSTRAEEYIKDFPNKGGRFREDLYHRLCVLRLDIPALRARGKDIEILAHRALYKFGGDGARQIRGFTSCAIEAMYRDSWPGNVRELINRIRRAIVLSDSCLISAADLDLA
ncbi:sigma54 specific transcriptional regulator, Fis family domain protein [Burkholderia thailandensis]|uniref:Sigma54 specific transcriptional regulator, Fis family domain protein n=1 Tax=Burkholderia thailandensis TaxID=57975 RepID=A0AAW9D0A5_BURTH|nr:sigma-54 dependent DNA-binding transcriptional regulator domain protein [Burkholderia thailandensis H0587]MDW9239308.1 sigma54 specific transcriptional regulator, Fis family domain protein [Burkholderia thailandensis]MDW9256280.1 sigma54 specific transcriptional regulator, Fis family domain protein [Burkholderia thailandensis]